MIHPLAEVQSGQIGKHTRIWQFVIILPGAQIGQSCNINCHVFIENDVVIGNNVTIKPGVQLWDGLRVGNQVFIGPNVTFTNDLIPRSQQYPDSFTKTIIEEGASIGANATIIAGITIGKYALIGAGSVVTKDVPSFSVWYGNPASHHGYVTPEGELLDKQLRSKKDGRQYYLKAEKLERSDD